MNKTFDVEILTESYPNNRKKMFGNMLSKINIMTMEKMFKKKQIPFDLKRNNFIKKKINKELIDGKELIIISRDIFLGWEVGRIISKNFVDNRIYHIVDIADNYDLLYDAFSGVKRYLFKYFIRFLFVKALEYGDSFFVVCNENKKRINRTYFNKIYDKNIYVLRNLPIDIYTENKDNKKLKNTMVYIGRIDEVSRDLIFVVDCLKELSDWVLHIYSSEKKETIKKIKNISKKNEIEGRLIIHNTVPYEKLHEEISKYEIGLVPHKRNLLTDYTVPNKIYDYLKSKLKILMSNNPSLVEENDKYNFGNTYIPGNRKSFIDNLVKLHNLDYDYKTNNLSWEENLNSIIHELKNNENLGGF